MTYVMSDLHGRWDLFQRMLAQIGFGAEDELYILGDVADRNRGGVRIFKAIMDAPNIRLLLGNHEHMLLHAMTDPEAKSLNGRETNRALWYRNGGRVTQEELEEEPEDVQRRILDYIRRLPLNINVEVGGTRWLLCHASPACLFRIYGFFYPNETEFAVWHRLEPGMHFRNPADVIVSGHTPTAYFTEESPVSIFKLREDVYDIDCGCAGGGRLGCLRLEDRKEFYAE